MNWAQSTLAEIIRRDGGLLQTGPFGSQLHESDYCDEGVPVIMPKDIESVFAGTGLSLFPERLHDLETSCSCPDWSNPCKHIAAVYYLLGEEFDRDPFLIFKLRGVEREHLTAGLGRGAPATAGEAQITTAVDKSTQPTAEPLDSTPGAFWHGADFPPGWLGEVWVPPMAAALPRRLGAFPFWRGAERFLDVITPAYSAASVHAHRQLLGEPD